MSDVTFKKSGPQFYLVICESEGTQLRFEVPNHETAILRSRNELLHVGIEGNAVYRILVSAEGPLQSGIFPHYRNLFVLENREALTSVG